MTESQPAKCHFCDVTSYTLNVLDDLDGRVLVVCDDHIDQGIDLIESVHGA